MKVRAGSGAVRSPDHREDEEEQEAVDVDDAFADANGDDRGAVEACDGGEELFGVQVHGRLLMLLRVVGILGGLLRIVDAGCLGAVGHVAGGLVSDGEVLASRPSLPTVSTRWKSEANKPSRCWKRSIIVMRIFRDKWLGLMWQRSVFGWNFSVFSKCCTTKI